MSGFYCPTCGMVCESDVAPWCRHNDYPGLAVAATCMAPLPSWHPQARAASEREKKEEKS